MRLKRILSVVAVAGVGLVLGIAPVHASPGAFSTTSLDFGSVAIGSSAQLTITVTNTTGSDASFDEGGLAAPFASDNNSAVNTSRPNACWFTNGGSIVRTTVSAGGTCLLYYRFSPTAAGSVSAITTVTTYDFIGSPADSDTLSLSGTGVAVEGPAEKLDVGDRFIR